MALVGTCIDYNGVQIVGCTLLGFTQTQIRDDSAADRVYDRVEIKVRGTVHLFSPTIHGDSAR
jgi:putative N-acetylmannosamine-6-phosphate epimerase